MERHTRVFDGIELARTWNAIAIAEGGRGGEVRLLGEVDAHKENTRRIMRRNVAKHSWRIFVTKRAQPVASCTG
jgi:transposase